MTENEYKSIDEAIDQAQESIVPFPVSTEDELSVVGDANKTEINKHDFEIEFLVPDGNKYTKHTKEFKNIYITPRQSPLVIKAMTALMPLFKKADGKGNVVDYTDEEKREIVNKMSEEVYDALYDVVAAVLHISDDFKDYMTPQSVIKAATNIIYQYPEMVNESDTFFE